MSVRWLVIIVAGLVGLTGIFVGVVARARPEGRLGPGSGPRGALISLAAGLIGAALSGVVLVTSDTDFAEDIGRVLAAVALWLGLIATLGGWKILARYLRDASPPRRPRRRR